jgi:dihydroxyacid dehydratase/phosphogluconate dehydratase
VAILGRRSGKTDRITATQLAYEALLGGHMQYVEPGQDVKILFIAQDIDMAASHLNFVNNAISSSARCSRRRSSSSMPTRSF